MMKYLKQKRILMMVVVAHLEWLLQVCQLCHGRHNQGCTLCRAGRDQEQAGALYPTKLAGQEP